MELGFNAWYARLDLANANSLPGLGAQNPKQASLTWIQWETKYKIFKKNLKFIK